MKKSKILLVTVLALVLCLLCVTTSTFSWLPRPKEDKGNSLAWNLSYETSVGKDITMTTYALPENGREPDDPHAQLTEVTEFSNSEGIDPGHRKYYRTDIINSGSEAQSISLFLSSLSGLDSTNGKFCLGVNGPLRTYRNYSDISSEAGSKIEKIINEKNVYVGFNVNQTYTPQNYAVHWWQTGNDNYNGDSQVQPYFSPNQQWDYANSKYNMSYATIPYDANAVKLRQDNNWYGGNNEDLANKNTIIVYSDNGNVNTDYQKSSLAAGIESFYSSAAVTAGDTIDLAAKGHTDTFSYTSSNASVATVSSTGMVTAIKAGHTTITVTSTGSYGDKITATCWLTVHDSVDPGAIFDVPIVTNVKVAPATEAGNTVESVYWYIKNDGSVALTYSIGDIYLTL